MVKFKIPPRFDVEIPPLIETKGKEGIKNFIATFGLHSCVDPLVISSTLKNANDGTIKEYHDRWEELKKFCF